MSAVNPVVLRNGNTPLGNGTYRAMWHHRLFVRASPRCHALLCALVTAIHSFRIVPVLYLSWYITYLPLFPQSHLILRSCGGVVGAQLIQAMLAYCRPPVVFCLASSLPGASRLERHSRLSDTRRRTPKAWQLFLSFYLSFFPRTATTPGSTNVWRARHLRQPC